MAARRFVITLALAFLLGAAGCRGWCDRHYPCGQSCGSQPACVPCVPCCPTNSAYQVPPPPPAPPANWNAPRGDCRCP